MRWIVDARTAIAGQTGGVSRVSAALCGALTRIATEGEITFVTTGRSRPELASDALMGQHAHIRIPNKLWSAGSFLRTTSFTESAARRIGECHAAFFPNIGFLGRTTLPYTLLLHDLSFFLEPRWFSGRMRLWHAAVRPKELIQNASHLFSVSETTKTDAVRMLDIPPERITVLPIGPTGASAGRETYLSPYVLAIGNGDPRKNTETAIKAVRELRKNPEWRDLHLVVLGSRPNTYEPWIVHEESADDERLASLYRHARVFLYPSWYEGYGLPLHEATAHGTPSIASTSGALPETAPPGTRFCDPAKPHHWIVALEDVLRSTAKLEERRHALPAARDWNHAAEMIIEQLRAISLQSG